MQTFRDSSGKEWEINLTFGNVLRVKSSSQGKFDLLEPNLPLGHPEGATDDEPSRHLQSVLWNDLAEFWELLWFIVEPQAKKDDIGAEHFGERMAAECIIDARRAFFKAWIDFFHKLQRFETATALEQMLRMHVKKEELIKARMLDELEDFQATIDGKLKSTVNTSFGVLRESLAAIPEDTRGEN